MVYSNSHWVQFFNVADFYKQSEHTGSDFSVCSTRLVWYGVDFVQWSVEGRVKNPDMIFVMRLTRFAVIDKYFIKALQQIANIRVAHITE
jgi:hypothetical protein